MTVAEAKIAHDTLEQQASVAVIALQQRLESVMSEANAAIAAAAQENTLVRAEAANHAQESFRVKELMEQQRILHDDDLTRVSAEVAAMRHHFEQHNDFVNGHTHFTTRLTTHVAELEDSLHSVTPTYR